MRLPVIPFVIAATLLAAVWYLFTAARSDHRTLDVPRLTRLADIDGTETEVAAAPEGNRLAVVAACRAPPTAAEPCSGVNRARMRGHRSLSG